MQEFVGLAYYTEIPAVIFDIQRTGPSTGMPTRTQQGDLLSLAYASHGDTKHIVLFPCNPEECFYLSVDGVRSRRSLSDAGVRRERSRHRDERLDVQAPSVGRQLSSPDRGKVLDADELETVKRFSRYFDAKTMTASRARTLPGVHPARRVFHARLGTRQARAVHRGLRRVSGGRRSADAEVRDGGARPFRRRRFIDGDAGADIGIVTIGGCHAAVLEAIDRLRDKGIDADYMRIARSPSGRRSGRSSMRTRRCFVVEQNRDGATAHAARRSRQVSPRDAMTSVLDYGGMPLTARIVVNAVATQVQQVPA